MSHFLNIGVDKWTKIKLLFRSLKTITNLIESESKWHLWCHDGKCYFLDVSAISRGNWNWCLLRWPHSSVLPFSIASWCPRLCLAAGNVLKFISIVAAAQEFARCTNDLRPKLVGNYFELPAPYPAHPPPPLSVVIFVTGQEIELKPTSVVQMAIKASTTDSVTMLSLASFANGKEEQILEVKYNCL